MMMMEKEDLLGLSLSLASSSSSSSSATSISPHQLALMPSSSPPLLHSIPFSCPQKPLWSSDPLFSRSDKRRPMLDACRGTGDAMRPLLRGIDVNQAPPSGMAPAVGRDNMEDAAGESSPNSTVSSAAGASKSGERFGQCFVAGVGDENDAERASSRGPLSDEEDGEGARKKLRLSKDQSAVLEESFKEHNTLNPKQKLALAKQLNLRPRQVEVWFQNRRARTKLKQTEVDCEFLKRCCENLTEENRRLQKEVQVLRALKLSPQLFMHMTPPTTLTMCPSCERVSNSGNMTGAAAATCMTSKSSSPAPEHHKFLLHHRPVTSPWAPPIPLHPQKS